MTKKLEFREISNQQSIEDLMEIILGLVGEKLNRQGLKETPKRVAKMYTEIFRGYDPKQKPAITVFSNNSDGVKYDGMITDRGHFYSHCEHHMVPFFGEYYFAYIPKKKIIGLSKVARLVQYHAAKLQVQERLTKDILDDLETALEPKGIALILSARHLCKEMRGVREVGGVMQTSDMRGEFAKNYNTRQEFLKLIS